MNLIRVIMKIRVLMLVLCLPMLQGCLVAAVGASIGAVKYANSKKHDSYNHYVLGMQKINMERQEHHLSPQTIMNYKEYAKDN